ncbi:hypothetical protein RchiOBHm_Chr6g0282001 [Rosa chinensis]|uniref:Uncharacterized protein n=1 Tax=Rosa chinensis TaxID=74649 RepID=A0A2P6PTP1_ROSCH|nr:hypothetical protein RchiOBHm_Chr6g0282001 [Rosa chinensis]
MNQFVVDVGDFLRFKSCVLYTEADPDQPLITIEVVAHVTRPELRSSELCSTNCTLRTRKLNL